MKKQIIYLLFAIFAFAWQGNAQCNYTLEMNDRYGDGWNGNTLDLLVNGNVVLDNVTLDDGEQDTIQFLVNPGDDISTVWNNTGSGEEETYYRILDSEGFEVISTTQADIVSGTITAECPSCLAPSDLTVSNIKTNKADVSWVDNSGGTASFIVEWGKASSTNWNSSTVPAGTTTFTLTGLKAHKEYGWKITADCGGGDTSKTREAEHFWSACKVVTSYPYEYGFEDVKLTYVQNKFGDTVLNVEGDWDSSCWSGNPEKTGALQFDPPYRWVATNEPTSSVYTGPKSAHSGNKYAYTEASGSNQGDVAELLSPEFDMSSLTNVEISFFYHMYGQAMGELHVDTYDGANWTNDVWVISGQQQNSDTAPWKQGVVQIRNNNITQIRFRAIRGWHTKQDGQDQCDIAVDDITVREAPACFFPTDLSVTNITENTAELSWTDNNAGNATYVIEYKEKGASSWNSVTTTAGASSYTLTGLNNATEYEWQVTADCGGTTSTVTKGDNFFTLGNCGIFTIKLIDDYHSEDGWNGGKLDIYVNGVLKVDDLTLETGALKEFLLPVNTDDILSFDYTAGRYPNENEYVVLDSNGDEVAYEGKNYAVPGDIGNPNDPSGLIACATCPPPTGLKVKYTGTDFVDLSWIDNTSGSSPYVIEYKEASANNWSSVSTTAGADTYKLTGLSSKTEYEWRVYTDCGGGTTSLVISGDNFTTECTTITSFPYNYGFEDATANDQADWTNTCWKADPNYSLGDASYPPFRWNPNSNGTPSDNTGPSAAHSGNLYAYTEASGSSSGDKAFLISPPLDLSPFTNGVEMTFYYHMYGRDMGSLHLDVYDGNDWVNDVWQLRGEQQSSSYDDWKKATVEFNNNVIKVRFRAIRKGARSDIGVDDISIYGKPVCQAPSALSVGTVTTDSATLSWTDNNNGSASYLIEYRVEGNNTWQSVTTNTGDTSYTLTGLEPAKPYEWQITSDCGSGNTGVPTAGDDFYTEGTCGTYKIELYDSDNNGWNNNTLDVYVNGTLVMDNLSLTSGGGPAVYELPVNTNDIISFDYSFVNYGDDNSYIVYDGSGNQVAIEGENGTTPEDIGNPSVPTGLVACASCPVPSDLTVNNTYSSSADLSWTDNTNGSASYVIEYKEASTTNWNSVTTPAGATSYTLTGLSGRTEYEWKIYADCGGGDKSIVVEGDNFTTDCDAISTFPYEYGFEDLTSNYSADWSATCWKGNPQNVSADEYSGPYRWTANDGNTPTPSTGPQAAHSGNKYAYTEATGSNYGEVAELITPPLDMSALNAPELSFYYHMYGTDIGSLRVDIFDGSNWNNDVWVLHGPQQTAQTDDWKLVLLPIDNTVQKVRFRATRGNGQAGDIAIDDISIHECRTPSDLFTSDLTTTSVKLNWTDNSSGNATYLVEWRAEGDTDWNSDTTTAGATSYQLTGLEEKTNYEWQVTASCDANSSSLTQKEEFTTWYCTSAPSQIQGNGITKLFVRDYGYENLNKATYVDLTDDQIVELKQNDDNSIKITFETGREYNVDIWIDYNDNLSFESNEIVFTKGQSTSDVPSEVIANVNPNTLGIHVMRIGTRDKNYTTPDPCFNGPFGETIDLKVNIVKELAVNNYNAEIGLFLHPNPTNGILNIGANNNIQNLQVFDLLGREILNAKPNSKQYTVNVTYLKAGTYVIKAVVNGKTGFYRFIKK